MEDGEVGGETEMEVDLGWVQGPGLFDIPLLGRRTRVLMATPDPVLRQRAAEALEADGHEVVTVMNAADLVKILSDCKPVGWEAGAPDAIVVDSRLMFPDGPGRPLSQVARDIPTIALVPGPGRRRASRSTVRIEPSAELPLPLDTDELQAAVRSLLRG